MATGQIMTAAEKDLPQFEKDNIMVEEGSIGIFFYFSIKGDVDMLISKSETLLDIQAETRDKKVVHINFNKYGTVLVGRIFIPDLFLDVVSFLSKDELSHFAAENPSFDVRIMNRGQSYQPGQQGANQTNFYTLPLAYLLEFVSNNAKVGIVLDKSDSDEILAFLHSYAK